MRTLLAIVAIVSCATAMAGEVYKWKDKDGRVHYGDKPKAEAAEEVEVRPSGAGGIGPAAGSEQAAADPQAAECARLTKLYQTYTKATALRETDNLGRTREYTDAERTQLLQQTQQKMQDACSPAAQP
jgi:hypothetical protein